MVTLHLPASVSRAAVTGVPATAQLSPVSDGIRESTGGVSFER
jgi:hypothetical protein